MLMTKTATDDFIIRAAEFAQKAHAGQTRKYSGAPYITHTTRVAARAFPDPLMTAVALLHDVIEDTTVTADEIEEEFGSEVRDLVVGLTNPSINHKDLPRDQRKEMDRNWLVRQDPRVKITKMRDRIDNLRELQRDLAVMTNKLQMAKAVEHRILRLTDKEVRKAIQFAELYAHESHLLYLAIGDADPALRDELRSEVIALLDIVGLER